MVEADLTREDLLNLIPRPIWLVAAAAVVVVAAAVVAVVEYSLGSATCMPREKARHKCPRTFKPKKSRPTLPIF